MITNSVSLVVIGSIEGRAWSNICNTDILVKGFIDNGFGEVNKPLPCYIDVYVRKRYNVRPGIFCFVEEVDYI